MKIAIPVEEKSLASGVCPSFGRTPYFLFYSTDTGEAEFFDNSAIAALGGAGIKAAQALADNGVETLLTPRCGENAQAVFQQAEIPLYKAIPGTARQNIDAFAAKQLAPLTEFHPGFHHGA